MFMFLRKWSMSCDVGTGKQHLAAEVGAPPAAGHYSHPKIED